MNTKLYTEAHVSSLASNYIIPAVAAAMGSCVALIGAHQIFVATLTSPSLEKPSTLPVAVRSFSIMAIFVIVGSQANRLDGYGGYGHLLG